MKARTGICASLCGSLLLGCSTFPSLSGLFGERTPAPVMRVAKDADAEYRRGKRLHLAGQYGEAQKAYLNALAIDPAHAEAKNGLAALIGASGDLDRAIAMLTELSTNHPASHVYANLGHALQLKGRDFDARDAFQRAVDLDPANETARKRLSALDEKLQGTAVAVIDEKPLAAPVAERVTIESVGPAMYAMRYPEGLQSVPPVEVVVAAEVPAPAIEALVAPAGAHVVAQAVAQGRVLRSRALPVELVNANGVTGLARQLRSLLPGDEWRVVRTRNHENFAVGATRIEYAPKYRKDAQQFVQDVGIAARLRVNDELQGARLRIVLGRDCRDFEQLKQKQLASEPQLPAS